MEQQENQNHREIESENEDKNENENETLIENLVISYDEKDNDKNH